RPMLAAFFLLCSFAFYVLLSLAPAFYLTLLRPPRSSLFPYTTLFRSHLSYLLIVIIQFYLNTLHFVKAFILLKSTWLREAFTLYWNGKKEGVKVWGSAHIAITFGLIKKNCWATQ